jgi:hypothetical protein
VFNFGLTAYHTNYGNDIEPNVAVDVAKLDIMVDGQAQTLQFVVVYGFFRITIETVAASLNLDKYNLFTISGNNVDVASPRFPVAFYYLIAVTLQKFCGSVFAPFS